MTLTPKDHPPTCKQLWLLWSRQTEWDRTGLIGGLDRAGISVGWDRAGISVGWDRAENGLVWDKARISIGWGGAGTVPG